MTFKRSIVVFLIGVVVSNVSFGAREGMTINKEVALAPGHKALPYLITRASNSDFIVAGSTGVGDHRAWATRVTADGKLRWEYVDGPPDGWTDFVSHTQHFTGAVDLPNQETLLCGLKRIDKQIIPFLVRIRIDGSLVEERQLLPGRPGVPADILCKRWGDGVAILGAVSGDPAGIGWLAKLDLDGKLLWEKFADYLGYGDALVTPSGDLVLISWSKGETYLVKINAKGELLARHPLTPDDSLLVHPGAPSRGFRVASISLAQATMVTNFDENLNGPTHKIELNNVGLKKCLELPDRTVLIFGSQFHHGATTASVSSLHADGTSSIFPLEPVHQSPWFIDAVPSGAEREFATVRQVDGAATLAWISIK